jgi:hypothetical protein
LEVTRERREPHASAADGTTGGGVLNRRGMNGDAAGILRRADPQVRFLAASREPHLLLLIAWCAATIALRWPMPLSTSFSEREPIEELIRGFLAD